MSFRATWVTRSFSDYRVPVFRELDYLLNQQLRVVYGTRWTTDTAAASLKSAIGERAIGLTGEVRIGSDGRNRPANSSLCIPYQPGLYRAVARTKPQVVVADGFFRWSPAAISRRVFRGTPLVICYEKTSHTERRAQWFRTTYRRAVVKFTDAMCCNGQLCQQYSMSLGAQPARITLGHMVADTKGLAKQIGMITAEERKRLRNNYSIGSPSFLYVGRLIELKGLRQLLSAWRRVPPETEATLTLVGEGPERPRLEQLIAEYELKGVRLVGQVPYTDVVRYFSIADALVMPTLEDNWSLVVPEAMACGLPVLCSKYNGCWPELVKPGRNGFVFDPLDPDEFAATLGEASRRGSELAKMGNESQRIIASYTPNSAARSIMRACELAIEYSRHRSKKHQGAAVAGKSSE